MVVDDTRIDFAAVSQPVNIRSPGHSLRGVADAPADTKT